MTAVDLEACLPEPLRAASPVIQKIRAGMSGAGVYRVEAGGEVYVLKVTGDEPVLTAWDLRLEVLRRVAAAGVGPSVVHADAARRAVVTAWLPDRGFASVLFDPASREAAIAALGAALRTVHATPAPPGLPVSNPVGLLTNVWASVSPMGDGVPAFARAFVEQMLAEPPPPSDRAPGLSHNDVNPSNLVFDGARVRLLDWDTAGLLDPLYDLGAAAMFLRLDDRASAALLSAHDERIVDADALPARFHYYRRLVAALAGTMFLHLARGAGHPGDAAATVDGTLGLADFYGQLRTGAIALASAEGQWAFGLAVIKHGVGLTA